MDKTTNIEEINPIIDGENDNTTIEYKFELDDEQLKELNLKKINKRGIIGYEINSLEFLHLGSRKTKYLLLDPDNDTITKSYLKSKLRINHSQKIKDIEFNPIIVGDDYIQVKGVKKEDALNEYISLGKLYISEQTFKKNDNLYNHKKYHNDNPLKLEDFKMALLGGSKVNRTESNYSVNTINNIISSSVGNYDNTDTNLLLDVFDLKQDIYVVGFQNDDLKIFKNNDDKSYEEIDEITLDKNNLSLLIYLMESESQFNLEILESSNVFDLLNNIDNYENILKTIKSIEDEYNEELLLSKELSKIDVEKLNLYLKKIENFKKNVSEKTLIDKLQRLEVLEDKLKNILIDNENKVNHINNVSKNIMSNENNKYNSIFTRLSDKTKTINELLENKKKKGKNNVSVFLYNNMDKKSKFDKIGNGDGYYFS